MTKYRHDGSTTYCYYMTESYSKNPPSNDDSDMVAQAVGAACPVQISVDIADQVTKNVFIPLTYTARIGTSDQDPDFTFPVPVKTATVPDYLLKNSSAANATDASTLYDISVANVVMCDYGKCDIFTALDTVGNSFSSTNNPNNFADSVAAFGSKEIIIPKDGKYTGFAHIVINIAGNSRADFVTFFPVQVGDVVGTAPTGIVADSKTTYCWASRDVSPFDPSIDQSTIAVRTDKNCPGSMKSALSAKSVLIGDSVNVDWSLQIDTLSADPTTLIAEVSTTDAVRNPRTGMYSVVPVSVLSACLRNAANGSACSTYSGGTSGTFDISEFDDHNLTNGIASYSSNYSFSTAGTYMVISRVAMLTTDGDRIDMAVYSSVQVTVPDTTDGSVFLYVGLGIGGLILLVGLLFCVIKKRRAEENTKNIPFRQPTVPAAPGTFEHSDLTGASSANFLTHKSPAGQSQTRAMLGYQQDPTFIMDGGNVDVQDQSRGDESFSLDPFSRPSFQDMDTDDESVRPSEMNKFSFQSGYDDESDWEFDTRSHQTNGQFSEFSSDGPRGTFHMQSNLPILEEDDVPHYATNDPRGITGSGYAR